jgi:hypothetical protein
MQTRSMTAATHERVVQALVPTAAAARSLAREFPLAELDRDGTLVTVQIYGFTYSDVIARIKEWMSRSRIGPVLVTDNETGEEFLPSFAPRKPLVWNHDATGHMLPTLEPVTEPTTELGSQP